MLHFHAWFQRVHLENLLICLPVSSPYPRANLWSPWEGCHHAVLQYPLLKESPPPEFWPFFLSCHWLSWSQKPCPHPWPCCTKDFLSPLSPPPLSAKVTLTTFFLNPLWAFRGSPFSPLYPSHATQPDLIPLKITPEFFTTLHTSLFQDSVFKNCNS